MIGLVPSSQYLNTKPLLPHGRRSPLAEVGLLGLLLTNTLVENLGVLGLNTDQSNHSKRVLMNLTYGGVLGGLGLATLECDPVALVLEALRSDKTLDLGGLGVGLCALLLGLNLAADDELANL